MERKVKIAMKRQNQALRAGFGIWKDKNHYELATVRDTIDFVNSIRANARM